MGVDHNCVFGYGFILRPFSEEFTFDMLYDYLENIENIEFVTDAYYSSEIFVYIKSNNGSFRVRNRGNDLVFEDETLTEDGSSITFNVTTEEIISLNKVYNNFKERVVGDVCWRAFYYAH